MKASSKIQIRKVLRHVLLLSPALTGCPFFLIGSGGDPCDDVATNVDRPFPVVADGGFIVDGGVSQETCDIACFATAEGSNVTCTIVSADDDAGKTQLIHCSGTIRQCVRTGMGRRPPGYVAQPTPIGSALGRYFAHAAELEAASVDSFLHLRRELRAHRAPSWLCRDAARAAGDEVRHAALTSQLARRFGCEPLPPSSHAKEIRPLIDVATDNAAEGCVRETLGALQACWQSVHARDASISDAMRQISEDETRHAQLAWDVHHWAMQQLTVRQQDHVLDAMMQARDHVLAECDIPPDEELRIQAGVPDVIKAAHLGRSLAAQLWS